jgi:hypothetical protein
VFLGVLSASGHARAEGFADPPARVQLKYNGGAGCPSEAAFSREVKARIRRAVLWVDSDPARHITVRAELRGGRARGSLEIIEPAAEPTLRDFDAETCSEVASALALVVALALDPNARTEPLPPEPEAPPAERLVPVAASVPPKKNEQAARALRFSAGPAVTVSGKYAPVVLVAPGLNFGARYESESLFAPALELTPLLGKTGKTGPDTPLATFSWLMARLDVCPLTLRASELVRLMPCVTSELGQLTVSGKADPVYPSSLTQHRFWADLGLSAKMRLVSDPLFVELGLSLLRGITEDTFELSAPEQKIYGGHQFDWLPSGMLSLGVEL